MILLVIMLGIFTYAMIYSLIKGDYGNAAFMSVLVAIAIVTIVVAIREQRKSSILKKWFLDEKNHSTNDEWLYHDVTVNQYSELVKYQMTISLIFITTTISSRCFLVDEKNKDKIIAGIVFTLATLLLGWWAIPHGPINTFKTLKANIFGQNKIMIGDFIADHK